MMQYSYHPQKKKSLNIILILLLCQNRRCYHYNQFKILLFLCLILFLLGGSIYVNITSSSFSSRKPLSIIFVTNTTKTVSSSEEGKEDDQQQHIIVVDDTTTANTTISTTNSSVIDDFNFDEGPIPCGVMKCFIPSKTSPNEVGYLIGESIYNKLTQGYEYGQYLQHKYNLSNMILLEPPINIPRNFDVVNKINSKLYRYTRPDDSEANRNKQFCINPQSCSAIPLTIQKIKRVPSDDTTLLVKCKNLNLLNKTKSEWEIKKRNIINSNNNNNSNTTTTQNTITTELVIRQFESSINQLLLIFSNEPEFVHDIQFYVTINGTIIHMDYDRIIDGRHISRKISNKKNYLIINNNTTQQQQQPQINNNPYYSKFYMKYVEKATKFCIIFLHEMKYDILLQLQNKQTSNNINNNKVP